jgi:hypothetical protein
MCGSRRVLSQRRPRLLSLNRHQGETPNSFSMSAIIGCVKTYRLLRARRERRSGRRAAEQRDEIAPPRVGHGGLANPHPMLLGSGRDWRRSARSKIKPSRRATAKKSDYRHRRLLRPRRERPSHRRAAEQRDETAPPRVGHGASPSGVTTGNKAVSSACHNAAGKSSGQSRSTTRSAAASSRPATCCAVRP